MKKNLRKSHPALSFLATISSLQEALETILLAGSKVIGNLAFGEPEGMMA